MRAAVAAAKGERATAMLTVALVSIWVLVSTTLMATAFYTMTAEEY
jgi:hypothetical protein